MGNRKTHTLLSIRIFALVIIAPALIISLLFSFLLPTQEYDWTNEVRSEGVFGGILFCVGGVLLSAAYIAVVPKRWGFIIIGILLIMVFIYRIGVIVNLPVLDAP